MTRYDERLRRLLCAVLITLPVLSICVVAQVVLTSGAVQEQTRRQPMLPPTTDEQRVDQSPAPRATTGVSAGGKQIKIQRFEVTGNTIIATDELHQIVAPYEGRSLTLFEIYDVADALTQHYRDAGYSVASVTVPEQKISDGTVQLEVVESRVATISVEGNEYYKKWFLERHTKGAAVGDVITEKWLDRDLLVLNDLPGLEVKAVLDPGSQFRESHLVLGTEEKLFEAVAHFNNYGRTSIGEWKVEGDFAANGLLGLADRLEFNVSHAGGGKLDYFNLGYSAPIRSSGTRAAAYFKRNDYKTDSYEFPLALQVPELSGDGDNFGFSLVHLVIRSQKENLYIGIGYDRVITRQLVRDLGLKEKFDISLMNLSLFYAGYG